MSGSQQPLTGLTLPPTAAGRSLLRAQGTSTPNFPWEKLMALIRHVLCSRGDALLRYEAGRCWPEAALPGGVVSQAHAVCSPIAFWGELGSLQPPQPAEHALQQPRPCHFPKAINLRGALQRPLGRGL